MSDLSKGSKVLLAIISLIIVLGIMVSGSSVLSIPLSKVQTHQVAKEFFSSITEGDLNRAFDCLAYFDEASDLEPNISYDEAKLIWVNRVNSLQQKGNYIKSFGSLKTWTDDTYPKGQINLNIIENGIENKYVVNIHFSKLNDKWKVQNIYGTGEREEGELEKAVSGYVGK